VCSEALHESPFTRRACHVGRRPGIGQSKISCLRKYWSMLRAALSANLRWWSWGTIDTRIDGLLNSSITQPRRCVTIINGLLFFGHRKFLLNEKPPYRFDKEASWFKECTNSTISISINCGRGERSTLLRGVHLHLFLLAFTSFSLLLWMQLTSPLFIEVTFRMFHREYQSLLPLFHFSSLFFSSMQGLFISLSSNL